MIFSIIFSLVLGIFSQPEVKNFPLAEIKAWNSTDEGGKSITLSWKKSKDFQIKGYEILRKEEGSNFSVIVSLKKDVENYIDTSVVSDRNYFYRIKAISDTLLVESGTIGPIRVKEKWFNMKRINIFVVLFLFFTFVLWYIYKAQKGVTFFVRKIPGLIAIEEAVGRATEMGKPVLYVPGIDDMNNIQTIASMVILGDVAKMTAQYETPLIVPICRPFVVPVAEETIRQGCVNAGRPDSYKPDNVRYLSDEQFAYTAGVDGIMMREKPAANLFLGSFFAESLVLAETGFSTGAIQVAGTANIHQLPFFVAACDYTLIGEELYAASAYLSREPKLLGTLKGSDLAKLLIMIVLFVGMVLESFGFNFLTHWFTVQ